MFAVQLDGSELNKYQCESIKSTDDKFYANGGSDTELVPGKNGLSTRRPTALRLAPIETNLSCGSSEIDGRRKSFTVSSLPKSIDIGFNDLTYSVKTGFFRKENKTVLNGLNGEFKSGELTAVMGPSGAGKSTLMDILAGYTTQNVRGHVTINGRERVLKSFRRQSAYIMQDHEIQPYITVMEAMHFSANLKTGSEISQVDKKIRIKQILDAIGLYEHRKTRAKDLSGGQRRRLAIALEIVDNPPVMFFDEPTSGLDSSTSTQVVLLLKKLAQEGRTIISTIHQPSALVFSLFDHLFAIAEGQCIYTGATSDLVPFLYELNLVCPESYNPSDYLMEISTNDYGYQNERLIEKTKNGKEIIYRKKKQSTAENFALEQAEKMTASGLITPVKAPMLPQCNHPPLSPLIEGQIGDFTSPPKKRKKSQNVIKFDTSKCCRLSETYATTFTKQLGVLLLRTFLIQSRDRTLTAMRFLIHFIVAIFIGILYIGIGNDAWNVFNNFRYIFFSIMFLMFTAFSSNVLSFPLQLPIVIREHFNRWYSLKAYYVAMTLADVPVQLGCTLIYVGITYFMTAQPLEFYRFGLFSAICMMTAFVAQSLGLVVSALFSVKNSAVFGPFFLTPFLIFSGFFLQMNDAHPSLHWLFHISFLKYGLEGASLAIFGYDRPKMNCDEIFCQFIIPKKFMKFIDMDNGDYLNATIALAIIFFLFRFTAFYVMWLRLKAIRY